MPRIVAWSASIMSTVAKSRWARRLLAPLLLLVVTIVLTHDCYFPLASVPEPTLDQGQMIWNLWHVAESVTAGKDPYLTKQVLYPVGANLATHTLVAGLFPLTLAVKLAVRLAGLPIYLYPFIAFKLAILICFWLLALCTWALLRQLGATFAEALIPAMGYGFASFFRMHTVHLNHLCGFFLPLSGLALVVFVKRPTARSATIAGFTVGVSIYFTEFFIFICLALVIYGLALAASRAGRDALASTLFRIRPRLLALALAVFVASIAFFVAHWTASQAQLPSRAESVLFSANLIGFALPSAVTTSIYPSWMCHLGRETNVVGCWAEAFVGFPLLILGLLGWRSVDPWVRAARTTAVVFFILALGPELQIYAADTRVPLPFDWLRRWPIMQQNRTPVRFVSTALLFWSIVATAGLQRVSAIAVRRGGRRAGVVLFAALAVWLAAESQGQPTVRMQTAQALRRFDAKVAPGPVLNLPVNMVDFALHSALQIFHHQPIATGSLARYTPHQVSHLDSLQQLLIDEPAGLDRFHAAGFRTVITGGPIPVSYQDRLRALAVEVFFVGSGAPRRALASFGAITGVGDFPPQWGPDDRLVGTRRFEMGGVRAKQLDVLADDNDDYIFDLFHAGHLLARITAPPVSGGGLRWRALELPPEARDQPIDYLEVRGERGDGEYAVRGVVLGG